MKQCLDLQAMENNFWKAINTVLLDGKNLPYNTSIIDEISLTEQMPHKNVRAKVSAITAQLNKYAWKNSGNKTNGPEDPIIEKFVPTVNT